MKNEIEQRLISALSAGANQVAWVAWRDDGTGVIFRAPENYSKNQACELVEFIYKDDDSFVTVHQL